MVDDRVRYRRAYKGYQVIYFKGEYYAIPWYQSVIDMDDDGQDATIITHRVSPRLRALVVRLCPQRLIHILRRVVMWMPLRRRLSLDEVTRSSDLLEVLRRIDRSLDGNR